MLQPLAVPCRLWWAWGQGWELALPSPTGPAGLSAGPAQPLGALQWCQASSWPSRLCWAQCWGWELAQPNPTVPGGSVLVWPSPTVPRGSAAVPRVGSGLAQPSLAVPGGSVAVPGLGCGPAQPSPAPQSPLSGGGGCGPSGRCRGVSLPCGSARRSASARAAPGGGRARAGASWPPPSAPGTCSVSGIGTFSSCGRVCWRP